MRDALGGTVTLVIIVIFIVIFLSYMAFNVNYTKAYRMKNKIIATYNDFNGNCTSECDSVIKAYAAEIGYRPAGNYCRNNFVYDTDGFYCKKVVTVESGSEVEKTTRTYYRIETKIGFDFPIIRNIFDNMKFDEVDFFWVGGDTKAYKTVN